MANKRHKPKPKPANSRTPLGPQKQFIEMAQEWTRIANAMDDHGCYDIAKAIRKYIANKRPTDTVAIDVPLEMCGAISRACETARLAIGIKFAIAASGATVWGDPRKRKTPKKRSEAMSEALVNAREELEEMET